MQGYALVMAQWLSEINIMYEFIYKAAKVSLKESVSSLQKSGGINMKIAGIAAQYIALNTTYKNRGECEKILKEVLDSNSASALRSELQKEGFLQVAPQMYKLLEDASFDESAAINLFKGDDSRGLLRYVNIFTKSRSGVPKRSTLLYRFLKILEQSCRRKSMFLSSMNEKHYSKDDLQRLLNLVSNMLPECIAKCEVIKERVTYDDKINSFGVKLKSIVQKNNTRLGGNDHKILLAISSLFAEYDFTLDEEFRAAVVKNSKVFSGVRGGFLTQRRVELLLLAISLKVNRSDVDNHALLQSLQIINAVKNLSDSDSNSDFEEVILYEESSITDSINHQADLFIEYFTNKKILPKEIVQDMISKGLFFGRALARDLFVASRYLILGMDISLISLSLVAGVNVFMTNGILILSMSAMALAAFIIADCANAYYKIDSVSAKFYQSCLDFYDLLSGKDKAGKEIVICYDGYVIYDESLKLENSHHSGLVLGVAPEGGSLNNSNFIGKALSSKCFSDSWVEDSVANVSISRSFDSQGYINSTLSNDLDQSFGNYQLPDAFPHPSDLKSASSDSSLSDDSSGDESLNSSHMIKCRANSGSVL